MAFDPSRIPDDSCVEGHLDGDPVYQVLIAIHGQKTTGRLTVDDGPGPNHMYFTQGRPVGVALAEHVHPLGQLLLELGRVNGQTFVRAQRLIAEGNRLAGQVFKELGVFDDEGLHEVLAIQARKKAEYFCRLGARPFVFCRGLGHLVGFTSTPLDIHVVIYLAVRSQLEPEARTAWIDGARELLVRIHNAPGDETGLPAPLAAFGFGVAEERFLRRIVGGWEKVSELCDNGTLPADEAAVLLRFLEVIGRLDKRQPPTGPLPTSPLSPRPRGVSGLVVPENLDDVFSSTVSATGAPVPPQRRASDSATLESAERTDPQRASFHDEITPPLDEVTPEIIERPAPVSVPSAPPVTSPAANDAPSLVLDIHIDEPAAPIVKKKKMKRVDALPSEGSGVLVSETKREKADITPMPSIVIEED
jgi:hypothetical protein